MDKHPFQILNKEIGPKGFKFCGISAGIKKSKKKDLGLIYSDLPCIACGMFTSNKVQSDSLKVCRENLKNKESRAVIVNSGNANCFVGKRGICDAKNIIKVLAKKLDISAQGILIASTGIVGKPLPTKIILKAIPKLYQGLNNQGLKHFAQAILTTDTFRKVISLKFKIKDKQVLMSGVTKGVGMIYPHLERSPKKEATMLAFIMTDAAIKKPLLESALSYSVNSSFNRITVDGCMSTNDTVLLLANGAAQNKTITKKDKDFELFKEALTYICKALSKMIIRDGEGATKIIEISVRGAKNIKEANLAANAVANSSLFKAAMFGDNYNWGRIVAAIGAAGIPISQNKTEISFNNQKVFKNGKVYPLKFKISTKEIFVNINLNRGKFKDKVYTCDLTPEYVKINAGYN